MASFRRILLILIAAIFCISGFAFAREADPGPEPIRYRVACIGDSLTLGVGSDEPRLESWPAMLARQEGPLTLETLNYGVYGSTVENGTPWSYTLTPSYHDSLRCNADIYLVLLGSNDVNSPTLAENFPDAYRSLLESYLTLPQEPAVIVVLPPDMYFKNPFHARSNDNIGPLRETERTLAEELGLDVIDLSELGDMSEYCVDGGHFNSEGYALFADFIYNKLASLTV